MSDGTPEGSAPAPAPAGPGSRSTKRDKSEKGAERQVALRVCVYVFVTHLIAGFIWLLFYLGGHADK
ncbi:DUF6126 family protein [Streptomyces gamaensis]|uniref:DUF6126 family protein n=1 Tax=Streptomyces gamaensis TaxID=1763542 RepID=A0ABW0YYS9_9ACTN